MSASARLLAPPLALLSTMSSAVAQITIVVGGGAWAPSIGVADLQSGAGSDLIPTYESDADAVFISVSGAFDDLDSWRVDVRKTDGVWDGALTLSVQRTGSGGGTGGIAGGTSYQEVTAIDTAFFTGSGNRALVPVQMELSGVSLQLPPDIYSTTLTYTVVDTL